jgi:hypothetical protein
LYISTTLWKALWRFLKKLTIELPYHPVILLLIMYLKEYKSGYNRDTCTLMFITALFTIAILWKQPRHFTIDRLKKLVYIHNGVFFSHRQNEIMSFAGKWMELEDIMLNEVSQIQKDEGRMFSIICGR